jgi:hypothetical protein
MNTMISPYWMVLVNIISVGIILIGIGIYRYIYPKKKINYFILLAIVSLLPCISIFRPGIYESGDLDGHIYRAIVFYNALKEGILIPSWGADLNAGFGYPVFSFIYLVPYYLISLIHFLGFSFITSSKIILFISFVSSGLIMYVSLKKLTKNELAAFAGSIVYLFTPYHLVDLHFRVAIAEVIAFVLTPTIFYFIIKIQESKKYIYVIVLGLLFGLFFLTHPAQFLFYTALFFVYLIYQQFIIKDTNIRVLIAVIISFFIGLSLSSFSWIARFTLTQYTHGSQLITIPVSYLQPSELLVSPWRYGFLFQGHTGELSFIIGYTQILLLFVALYVLFRIKTQNKNDKLLWFWTLTALFLIFCMLPYSKFIWNTVPLLNLMQFSYRLLHPLTFCLAIITSYIVLKYNKRTLVIHIFLVITVAYTILNWGNRNVITYIDDLWMKNHIATSTQTSEGMIEANPLWWSPEKIDWIKEVPKQHVEAIHGRADIREIKRTSINHSYIVSTADAATLMDNTFYFPNWTIRVDGKPVGINYQTTKYPARMVFEIPKGLHYVEVSYKDIPIIQYAKRISLLVLAIIFTYLLVYFFRMIKRKNTIAPSKRNR